MPITIDRVGNQVIIRGTDGNDQIQARQGPNNGLTITVNGETQSLSAADAEHLVLDAGAGDDRIEIDDAVQKALRLIGGLGRDFLKGGAGNDILEGGDGEDSLLGADGDDILIGGAARDDMNGGNGVDTVHSEDDPNFVGPIVPKDNVTRSPEDRIVYDGRVVVDPVTQPHQAQIAQLQAAVNHLHNTLVGLNGRFLALRTQHTKLAAANGTLTRQNQALRGVIQQQNQFMARWGRYIQNQAALNEWARIVNTQPRAFGIR